MRAYKLRCHKCDAEEYPGVSELIDHLRAEHGDLFDITDEDYDTPWDAISQLRGCDVMSDALLFSAEDHIADLEAENKHLRELAYMRALEINCQSREKGSRI